MTEIRVNASTGYCVSVGAGASLKIAEFIRRSLHAARKVAVITDSNVDALHSAAVLSNLQSAGIAAVKFVFPAGEKSKNLATYSAVVDFLSSERLSRSDVIVALGGGVVGDMSGFAAATYKRGMDYIQVPTTLLAMVDSSVGGKTGLDIAAGKNMIGAFHQPKAVFCDTDFLETLPEKWRMDGMGEVLKYAVMGDAGLFGKLEAQPAEKLTEEEIASCIKMKRSIVEADEKESGIRKVLNLGHSFAHAIEKLSGFSVPHGSAVSTGVAMACRVSEKKALIPHGEAARVDALVVSMGGEPYPRFSPGDIARVMLDDKKVEGCSIDLVLPTAIGRVEICPTPLTEIEKVVSNAF